MVDDIKKRIGESFLLQKACILRMLEHGFKRLKARLNIQEQSWEEDHLTTDGLSTIQQ